MEVERLLRVGLLAVGDERDGLVDQVLAQVVALLGLLRRLDRVVVVHEVRIPLARVATEEAVEALEAPAQRPAVVRACSGLLVARRQVPLPDHERAVALLDQDLRQHPVLERHHAVVARIAGRQLGDAGHPVRVMVAAGDDARPRRRAQRRRVHVVVAQPLGRDPVQVRRPDRAPVAAELTEAGVVEHDEQHVRRTLGGANRRRPGRTRLLSSPADHTGKRCSGLVLDDGHQIRLQFGVADQHQHILAFCTNAGVFGSSMTHRSCRGRPDDLCRRSVAHAGGTDVRAATRAGQKAGAHGDHRPEPESVGSKHHLNLLVGGTVQFAPSLRHRTYDPTC